MGIKNRAAERLRRTIIARIEAELRDLSKMQEAFPATTDIERGSDIGRSTALNRSIAIAKTSTYRTR